MRIVGAVLVAGLVVLGIVAGVTRPWSHASTSGRQADLAAQQVTPSPESNASDIESVTPTVTATSAAIAIPTAATSPTDIPNTTEVIAVELTPMPGEEMQGDCWIGAEASGRPNAWRCDNPARNEIYDPCFSFSDDDTSVVCAISAPWDAKGVRMHLDAPLPLDRGNEDDLSRVWALEIVDPVSDPTDRGLIIIRCTFMGGATSAAFGERVSYACQNNALAVTSVQANIGTFWTATVVQFSEGEPIKQMLGVPVRTVWR